MRWSSHNLGALFNQPLHTHAFLAAGFLIQHGEDLLQALNMAFSLFQMPFKTLPQVWRRRSLRHFRKRFGQLLLGTVNVLQFVNVEFAQRVFCQVIIP